MWGISIDHCIGVWRYRTLKVISIDIKPLVLCEKARSHQLPVMPAASVILEFPLFEFILPFLCSSRCNNVLTLDILTRCQIPSGYTITYR
jgi:hypothetical protein